MSFYLHTKNGYVAQERDGYLQDVTLSTPFAELLVAHLPTLRKIQRRLIQADPDPKARYGYLRVKI